MLTFYASTLYYITYTFLLQCSLDLEFVNANISGEMAQLMISNQERYVPTSVSGSGNKEIVSPIGMHGDQLFEERARNVQWTYRFEENKFDKLEGINTEFADWHAKVTLYKVINWCDKYFCERKFPF